MAAANSESVVMPTNRAASPTEAPRPRALRATTGSTAPAPIDQIADGPKAGSAMLRSENSSGPGVATPTSSSSQLSRPMPEPSPRHRNRSGANLKVLVSSRPAPAPATIRHRFILMSR